RRQGFADSEPPQLPAAAPDLRGTDDPRRAVPDAWTQACLCPAPVRRIDWMGITGSGWSNRQIVAGRTTTAGSGCPADNQPRARTSSSKHCASLHWVSASLTKVHQQLIGF